MTGILHNIENNQVQRLVSHENDFKNAVQLGLSRVNKAIPSRFFYDAKGSELFNLITQHPGYYLTLCEFEILESNKHRLAEIFKNEEFNLIELGPGEAIKTEILINHFLMHEMNFTYMPVDISENYLRKIIHGLNYKIPQLKVSALHADYYSGLKWLKTNANKRNVVLFLGSSIGNFNLCEVQAFLKQVHHMLNEGDYLLIGFDLRKDIDILLRAYNDSEGYTRDFNLNLLHRMNKELGANFDIKHFAHYANYNVYTGAMESFIISRCNQIVNVESLQKYFYFNQSEGIHTEYSYKYLLSQVESFAMDANFQLVENFLDMKGYFVDSLWRVKK